MKHLIRDIIIFFIDVFGISFLYGLYCRRKGPLVRVVCFHDVPDRQWFEDVLNLFTGEYHVVTPEQFHKGNFSDRKINILLTFDDGYQSWIDNCLPVLRHHGLKGIFFVNSGLLDAAEVPKKADVYMASQLRILPKKALTWDGLRQLSSEGHSIGGHTVTHQNLAGLTIDAVFSEVNNDKKKLEDFLQNELIDFAFPFGTSDHFSPITCHAVMDAGYIHQYSALPGFFHGEEPIQRTLLEYAHNIVKLRRWVAGGYDLFSAVRYAYRPMLGMITKNHGK